MSKITTEVLNPDDIEFKFEITFTLREWKKISESFKQDWNYPTSELTSAIRDCTYQAQKTFWPKKEEQ